MENTTNNNTSKVLTTIDKVAIMMMVFFIAILLISLEEMHVYGQYALLAKAVLLLEDTIILLWGWLHLKVWKKLPEMAAAFIALSTFVWVFISMVAIFGF